MVKAISGRAEIGAFAQSVEDQYRHYLAMRSTYYGWERRWPDSPFWRQFQPG